MRAVFSTAIPVPVGLECPAGHGGKNTEVGVVGRGWPSSAVHCVSSESSSLRAPQFASL